MRKGIGGSTLINNDLFATILILYKMDKGPRFLLCENLQTTPEDFYVFHNRIPFVVIRFNSDLEIVGTNYISDSVDEKTKSKTENNSARWIYQYIKDTKLQQTD